MLHRPKIITAYLIALSIPLLAVSLFAQSPADGRYLENGKWQPRNSRSTMDIPQTGDCQAEPPGYITTEETSSIMWEPSKRLSFGGNEIFNAAITEGINGIVYAAASKLRPPNDIYYISSTDYGQTWESGRCLFESDPISDVVDPQINSDSNIVTIIFNNNSNEYLINSLNYGQTWSSWRNVVMDYGTGRVDFDKNRIYLAVSDPSFNLTQVRYSQDHGFHWNWHSNINTITGEVDIGINDGGLHVGQAGPGVRWCEIYYLGFYNDSTHWTPSLLMSSYDSVASFWPRVKAWNNNVVLYWTDYKYSPYAWTGDILMRRSADNGFTWENEIQVTNSHLVLHKNMCERNDSLFLVYDEIVLEDTNHYEEIMFRLSPDGGLTWESPIRLTYSCHISIEPAIAVMGNRIHVAFSDIQDSAEYKELYYRRGLISSDNITDSPPIANLFGLSNYPNPFNGKTTFEFNLPVESDVRLNIYDISGRLVNRIAKKLLAAGTHQLEWEGRDTNGKEVCSGLYIATLVAGTQEDVIKIAIVK